MHASLQITFRNFSRSAAVEEKIRERAARLERYFADIVSCHVVVELLHRHHRQGNHFQVRIDLKVPGSELVASREPDQRPAYTDVFVAIRDAFDAMDRLLEEYVRRMRRQVKAHETPAHGRIAELHRAEDYGRIATADGRSVYFHRNSLVDGDFDRLELDAEVRYAEEQGERGPQASTVHLVGRHHIVG